LRWNAGMNRLGNIHTTIFHALIQPFSVSRRFITKPAIEHVTSFEYQPINGGLMYKHKTENIITYATIPKDQSRADYVLSEEQKNYIRELRRGNPRKNNQLTLAKRFNVPPSVIQRVAPLDKETRLQLMKPRQTTDLEGWKLRVQRLEYQNWRDRKKTRAAWVAKQQAVREEIELLQNASVKHSMKVMGPMLAKMEAEGSDRSAKIKVANMEKVITKAAPEW